MPQLVAAEGVRPIDHVPDEQEVIERAEQTWERTRQIKEHGRSIGGIPSENPSIALIIDEETGALTGYNHLEIAKAVMEASV